MALLDHSFPVIVGVDVGKAQHFAVARFADGTRLHDGWVANDEAALRAFFAAVAGHGAVLVCVDQPASIGALTVAVAQACGHVVCYLPGRRMHAVAETFPGRTKSDRRDAETICEAARTMRHSVRLVSEAETIAAQLRVLVGHDDDLARTMTAERNRLRGLLTTLHPPLERVLGPCLLNNGVLELLARYPTPQALQGLGASRLIAFLRRHQAHEPQLMAQRIGTALADQTLTLPGTDQLDLVLAQQATRLRHLRDDRRAVHGRLAALVAQHPDGPILRSLPGFGVKLTARTIVELDGKTFASSDDLAAYAGVAALVRESGSTRIVTRNRFGNQRLATAWFQAASSSLRHDRRYYDRKRGEGMPHVKAIWCLARQRARVLYRMLQDRTHYQEPAPASLVPT